MSLHTKEGYYLSSTIVIDPIGNVVGSSSRHDQALTLWKKDGYSIELIHHWELERITGYKHHNIPFALREDAINFINECLLEYQITFDDLVNIIGTPELEKVPNTNYFAPEIFDRYPFHPIAHAFSCMLSDSERFYNSDILALSCDGGPDDVLDNRQIEKDSYVAVYSHCGELQFDSISSPALLWAFMADKLEIGEGTLMALASASNSVSFEFQELTDSLIPIYRVTSFEIIKPQITNVIKKIMSYSQADAGIRFNKFDLRFTERENKISMIMKIIQNISIRQIERTIDSLLRKYKISPCDIILSLSGGYFLNCPTNTHLQQKYKFKDILIMPACNDSGISIGIGLFYFYYHHAKICFSYKKPFLGDSDDRLDYCLDKYSEYIEEAFYTDSFVDMILDKPVVWFDGRAEIGPRALGHRSILADPCNLESKNLLNQYKQREWWRPVAPIVLEECRNDWFDSSFYSPFMLHNFMLKKNRKDKLPAILHLDGSCRVQCIDAFQNERLYNYMIDFYKQTGIPILCNTSLNDKDEPIINSIEQAFNFILRKGIKYGFFYGKCIVFKNYLYYSKKEPLDRYNFNFGEKLNYQQKKQYNPYGFTDEEYILWKSLPELNQLTIDSESSADMIKTVIKRVRKMRFH